MKICVEGLWHLGLVTSACLASKRHSVVGFDRHEENVAGLNAGQSIIFEPGLDDLLKSGMAAGALTFTADAEVALSGVDVLWVAYDTPVDEDDHADVGFVMDRIKESLPYLDDGTLVLISSQLPAGSVRELAVYAAKILPAKTLDFAYSPENLRLGKAIDVFLRPDRVVVGFSSAAARMRLEDLFAPITDRIEWMSVESAEMTKHAINAFLAVSVAFANEIASICELVGADAKDVERGMKTEARIGPKAYLSPGGPFAGGTLARDIVYLNDISSHHALPAPVLQAVKLSNDAHKGWILRKISGEFSSLEHVKIAVWGLTYKPGTDTLRRSLAVELCNWLIAAGAQLHVYDPRVVTLPEGWNGAVIRATHALDALSGVDALVIGTEWPCFREQANAISHVMKPGLRIFDANRFLQNHLSSGDIKYFSVGTVKLGGVL